MLFVVVVVVGVCVTLIAVAPLNGAPVHVIVTIIAVIVVDGVRDVLPDVPMAVLAIGAHDL